MASLIRKTTEVLISILLQHFILRLALVSTFAAWHCGISLYCYYKEFLEANIIFTMNEYTIANLPDLLQILLEAFAGACS